MQVQREKILHAVSSRLERIRGDMPVVEARYPDLRPALGAESAVGRVMLQGVRKIEQTLLERTEELLTPEQDLVELYNNREHRDGVEGI